MASTAADLAKDVLLELSKVDAQDDPAAEDQVYITRISKMELAQLRKRQIAFWTYNSIPDEVYNSYVLHIANMVGPKFGVERGGQAAIEASREQLATDAKPRFTGAAMKSDYPLVAPSSRFDFTSGS